MTLNGQLEIRILPNDVMKPLSVALQSRLSVGSQRMLVVIEIGILDTVEQILYAGAGGGVGHSGTLPRCRLSRRCRRLWSVGSPVARRLRCRGRRRCLRLRRCNVLLTASESQAQCGRERAAQKSAGHANSPPIWSGPRIRESKGRRTSCGNSILVHPNALTSE